MIFSASHYQTFLRLAAFLALIFLSATTTHAATYYVSTSGNNSNSGSQSQPWGSIYYASQQVNAGDTIAVFGGTYSESIELENGPSGTQANPITLTNHNGQEVIVNSNSWVSLYLKNTNWWIVDGIKFRNASIHNIEITNSHHVTIQNCEASGAGSIGIHLMSAQGPVRNSVVRNCQVHHNGTEGIYLDIKSSNNVPIENNLVENNHVHNNGAEGLQNTRQSGDGFRPSSNTFRSNLVHDNSGDWAGADISGSNIVFENNIIHTNSQTIGGVWYANGSNSVFQNNLIYNNSGTNGDSGGLVVGSNVSNTKIYHNTIYGNSGSGGFGINLLSSGSTLEVKNNILANNKSQIRGSASISHNLIFGSSNSTGSNAIQSNPNFIHVGSADFHLISTSPAINAGTNLGVTTDIEGSTRPQGATPDLGAYEFAGSQPPPPTTTPIPTPTPTPPPTSGPTTTPRPPCPTDINHDDITDLSDYSIMLTDFFTTNSRSDFNHDGLVDLSDYSLLAANFLVSCP